MKKKSKERSFRRRTAVAAAQQGCDPRPGPAVPPAAGGASERESERASSCRNGSGPAALISRERSLEQLPRLVGVRAPSPGAGRPCGATSREGGERGREGTLILPLVYVVRILYCLEHVDEPSKLGLVQFPKLSPSPLPHPLKFFPFYVIWYPEEILDYQASFRSKASLMFYGDRH